MTTKTEPKTRLAQAMHSAHNPAFAVVAPGGDFVIILAEDLEQHRGLEDQHVWGEVCGLIGQKARTPLAEQLVKKVGRATQCGRCGAPVYLIRHESGRSQNYEESGVPHVAVCPARGDG